MDEDVNKVQENTEAVLLASNEVSVEVKVGGDSSENNIIWKSGVYWKENIDNTLPVELVLGRF